MSFSKLYAFAFDLYLKCEKIPILSSINLGLYRLAQTIKNPASRRFHYSPALAAVTPPRSAAHLSDLCIAMIADEMTYSCFSNECRCIALKPAAWYAQLCANPPHFFFCESAWLGNHEDQHSWRGQIYKNDTLFFENRKTVLDVLDFCKRSGIPTVFWNKEDPTHFDDHLHNFVDLALRFDHCFTTSAECVSGYQARGAKHADCMMMGVAAKLYNPLKSTVPAPQSAVFAGSWYAEHPQRCADTAALFDSCLDRGITLTIYDRNSKSSNHQNCFPEKYRPFVHPAIPFAQLSAELKRFCYALNINTVRDSATMFARRVFEVMACGLYVISNESAGLRKLFGDRLRFTGEDLPTDSQRESAVASNIRYVLQNHTYQNRLQQLVDSIDIAILYPNPRIKQFSLASILDWNAQKQQILTDYDYFAIGEEVQDWEDACLHFQYLETGIGVTYAAAAYQLYKDSNNEMVLFRAADAALFDNVNDLKNKVTRKYSIGKALQNREEPMDG